jgi:hypothetical protein
MNSLEADIDQAMRLKFELAAFTGLLANPRYTKNTHGEMTQLCKDARRYAAEMIREKRKPVPIS